MIDSKKIKNDFPIFKAHPKMIYFDSGATTQKPKCVIDAISDFYSNHYATVHRGIYELSVYSTDLYDAARLKVKQFINAKTEEEIIFTRGTTDSINLVARALSLGYLKQGDEIIVTQMEHHSNLVPWQMVCQVTGSVLKAVPINEKAELDLEEYKKLLSDRTRVLAVGHIANSTGTINPVKEMIKLAKEKNALTLVDGAQAAAHLKVDVQDLDCDFYAFSGHKVYGPTGIGILYGKRDILEKIPPVHGGGDMIEHVELYSSTYQKPPLKFEAGTPMIAEVIGLKPALDYLDELGREEIFSYEKKLTDYATEEMKKIPGLKIIGQAKEKGSLISFIMDKIHPLDLGTLLDTRHIALRTGHHCAQPTMQKFDIPGTARISFGIYNDMEEVDLFIKELKAVISELA